MFVRFHFKDGPIKHTPTHNVVFSFGWFWTKHRKETTHFRCSTPKGVEQTTSFSEKQKQHRRLRHVFLRPKNKKEEQKATTASEATQAVLFVRFHFKDGPIKHTPTHNVLFSFGWFWTKHRKETTHFRCSTPKGVEQTTSFSEKQKQHRRLRHVFLRPKNKKEEQKATTASEATQAVLFVRFHFKDGPIKHTPTHNVCFLLWMVLDDVWS